LQFSIRTSRKNLPSFVLSQERSQQAASTIIRGASSPCLFQADSAAFSCRRQRSLENAHPLDGILRGEALRLHSGYGLGQIINLHHVRISLVFTSLYPALAAYRYGI